MGNFSTNGKSSCNTTNTGNCNMTPELCDQNLPTEPMHYNVLPESEAFSDEDETEQIEREEETFALYQLDDGPDVSPFVNLKCFGVWTRFVVDTGCDYTVVHSKQLEIWGRQPEEGRDEMPVDISLKGTTYKVNISVCNF